MEQLCRTIKTERNGWKAMYLCDCGVECEVLEYSVNSGATKSCGCLQRKTVGSMNRAHNMSHNPTYKSWYAMKQRCTNPRNHRNIYYKAKGITYDPKWETFEGFLEDMGEKPGKGWSLDRIDNNGNYCKENCQWLTLSEHSIKSNAERSNR